MTLGGRVLTWQTHTDRQRPWFGLFCVFPIHIYIPIAMLPLETVRTVSSDGTLHTSCLEQGISGHRSHVCENMEEQGYTDTQPVEGSLSYTQFVHHHSATSPRLGFSTRTTLSQLRRQSGSKAALIWTRQQGQSTIREKVPGPAHLSHCVYCALA